MNVRQCPALLLVTLLASCATPPATESNIVRLCDSSGCEEVDKSTARFDPATTVPDADPEGRMPALEKLANEDPRAAHDLALRLFRGDGVRRDSYKALEWMRNAGERGDLAAQKALGRLYLTGLEEMGADPREAETWLTLAASRGDKESEELLPEASKARQSEEDAYEVRARLRQTSYNFWKNGYRYYTRWTGGAWIF